MKKSKVFFIILTILLLCFLSTALMACDLFGGNDGGNGNNNNGGNGNGENVEPPTHTHSWNETYSMDEINHWFACSGCDKKKDYQTHSFKTKNNETEIWQECSTCGYETEKKQFTQGLSFKLNNDSNSYYVSGIGTVNETDIIIPSTYNDKPITSIGEKAFEGCSSLTSITIPDSVTSIGNDAFSGCRGLTSITIPDRVTSIGNDAFYGCSNLQGVYITDIAAWCNISFSSSDYSDSNPLYYAHNLYLNGELVADLVIPDSVTRIGEKAFRNCSSLTSVTIPNSVTSIGNYAFSGCRSLTSVTIPNSVTNTGYHAFYGCNGLTIYCEMTSQPSDWDSSWKHSNYPVVWDCNNNEIADDGYIYIVVDGIRYSLKDNIATVAAQPSTISGDIVIPDSVEYNGVTYSVTSIGSSAFEFCSKLTSITIPNSITSISDRAFEYCTSLTSITIPDSVTSISEYAFFGCSKLTSITIPDSVTSIGESAFESCTRLTSITIGNSVTTICYEAFEDCSSLTSITIPDIVTSIGGYAFRGCNSLTIYCEVASTPSGWSNNWNYSDCPVVWDCNNNEVADDGYNYTVIDGIRYGLKDNIAKVVWQPSSIGSDIVVPESVEYNGTTYSVTQIGDNAFKGCTNLTSITIPDSVTSIGNEAFKGCTNLTSITIPDSVTSIGNDVFKGCTSLQYNEYDNALYLGNEQNPYLVLIKVRSSIISRCSINANTKFIINSAFYGCSRLTSVAIGNSVTSIGDYAFYDCSSLTSITIPDSATSIGNYAFKSCKSLSSVTLGNSVTNIGGHAFWGCSKLTSITLPDSVTSIGNEAFKGCYILESLTIPFVGATKNETENTHFGYIFGASSYGDNSKYVPSSLKSVVITSGDSIGECAFYGCSKLTSITIPDSVTSIGSFAFSDCTSLINITIPNSIIIIGYGVFYGCSSLTSITIPDSLTSIGDYAFSGCSSLTSIIIPDSVTIICREAFSGCSSLTSITIPDSVTSIGYQAFYKCSSLTSITIPNSVTSIGGEAFRYCTSLTSITIPDGVTNIDYSTFNSCSSLTSIIIPDSVTSIGQYAFSGCSSLTTINYNGTMDEWKAIEKGIWGNDNTNDFTIICTNGKLDKKGNVIE